MARLNDAPASVLRAVHRDGSLDLACAAGMVALIAMWQFPYPGPYGLLKLPLGVLVGGGVGRMVFTLLRTRIFEPRAGFVKAALWRNRYPVLVMTALALVFTTAAVLRVSRVFLVGAEEVRVAKLGSSWFVILPILMVTIGSALLVRFLREPARA